MFIKKLLIAAALAVPGVLAFSAPANAQAAGGIATADPTLAIYASKAYAGATTQIRTTFKDSLDKASVKETDRQKLLAQLDKNGDKNVDDSEIAAAQQAKNPALQQVAQLDQEIAQLRVPAIRAQLFAIEMILQRYQEAQKAVIAAKKISLIFAPEAFVYYPDSADVTQAITTELDRIVPTVPITAPANWRPTQETLQVQQRLGQISQILAAQAAAQPRPAGAPPAAGAAPPAASGRPVQQPPQSR